ncbi:hypothetical protein, partial [Sutterella sp.]|uniref:hypothetical protein n=1 Tax=Sutterella sp. TaxID=1981025 RepID=UPI003FD81A2C
MLLPPPNTHEVIKGSTSFKSGDFSYTFANAAFELSSDATFTGTANTSLSLHASDASGTPAKHAFRFNVTNTTFTTFKKIELVGEGPSKQTLVPSKGNSTLSFGTSTSDVISEVSLQNLNVGFWDRVGNTINFYTEKLDAKTTDFTVSTDNTVKIHGVSDSQSTTLGTVKNTGGVFSVEQGSLALALDMTKATGGTTNLGSGSGKTLSALTLSGDVNVYGGTLTTYADNAQFQNVTVSNKASIAIKGAAEGQRTKIAALKNDKSTMSVDAGALEVSGPITSTGTTTFGKSADSTLTELRVNDKTSV